MTPKDPEYCPMAPELTELTNSVKLLASKMEELTKFASDSLQWNRLIIKWLLMVVCVIALGNKAGDLVQQMFNREAKAATLAAAVDK